MTSYLLTLLANHLVASEQAAVIERVHRSGLSISQTRLLTEEAEPTAHGQGVVFEYRLQGHSKQSEQLGAELLPLAEQLAVDLVLRPENSLHNSGARRLVVLDMDSTLIQVEVIDEMALRAGVADCVTSLTEQAMQGLLPFRASLIERTRLLAGLPVEVLAEVAENLPLAHGARRLLNTLKKLGYCTAVISGGFEYFGRYLQQQLDIDHLYANKLDIQAGRLTGRVSGEIIDGERKALLLKEIAASEGIPLEQVVAVGDGANDLPMLAVAGFGIAYHAKPLVRQVAQHNISSYGLDGILYLLGMTDKDIRVL